MHMLPTLAFDAAIAVFLSLIAGMLALGAVVAAAVVWSRVDALRRELLLLRQRLDRLGSGTPIAAKPMASPTAHATPTPGPAAMGGGGRGGA